MNIIKIIDTHCHPQFPHYDEDREVVIQRAIQAGIAMVCVGTDLATSRDAIALAGRYEGIYASVGLHPNDNLEENYDPAPYLDLAHHPRVVAIGEIGLDHYRTTDTQKRSVQKNRFMQQLDLAQQVNKPVIIHCRDAHVEMLALLPEYRGVIHSFTGTSHEAAAYIKKGYFIGLNGIVTFAKEYEDMVRSLPANRILLETDAPYLAPAPFRGRRNEPANVVAVGNFIAALRGEDAGELVRITKENACYLFSIRE